jgi:hypothetical protein
MELPGTSAAGAGGASRLVPDHPACDPTLIPRESVSPQIALSLDLMWRARQRSCTLVHTSAPLAMPGVRRVVTKRWLRANSHRLVMSY